MSEPSIEHRMDLWLADMVDDGDFETDDERREYAAQMRKTFLYAATQLDFAVTDLVGVIKEEIARAVTWLARRLP